MRSIRRIPRLRNIPVLVRAALNVPVADGKVANAFRLRQALPTIEYLRGKGARVILCGHIGDQGTETFRPVYEALQPLVPGIEFCPAAIGKEARDAIRAMRAGDVLLLENLRRHRGEKLNDPEFARELASLADVFVEDSFDVCHRAHASVVGVPELLPSYAGFLVETEVKQLAKARRPRKPALAIIAGAKFSTKEPVILALLSGYAHVFIGGALANDFLLAGGNPVGVSLVSGGDLPRMRQLLRDPRILVPKDVIVAKRDAPKSSSEAVPASAVPADGAIYDIGPGSIEALAPYVAAAKTILWNGTLGRYEDGYTDATRGLALLIAGSRAHSIVGGGDTVAALEELGLSDRFSFVSTGGGAMLDYLAYGTLPGLDALERKRRARPAAKASAERG